MIRVLLIDDHPAMRAGLHTVLRAEPGIVPVGDAGSVEEALAKLESTRADVVLVDYHLPSENGLFACYRITARGRPPHVLVYSAYATAALAIPSMVAGASGIASKGAPADELLEAIRLVARGRAVLPALSREVVQASAAKLDAERELPVFGMLLDGTPRGEIAGVLGVDLDEIEERILSIISKLRVPVPAGA